MADKRCFVQFPHPGCEHKPYPEGSGKIGWNKLCDDHKRKFMQLKGEWIDKDGNRHAGNLRAWGEWEPESQVIHRFKRKNRGPHDPRYLWGPYWVPKNTYQGLHNTDPFIFGDRFLYSNCGQSAQSRKGLKHLEQGSVIAFGSGKKIGGKRQWMLDTVLVVKDSILYDPLNPFAALEGKVSDEFLEVTGGPLGAWIEDSGKEATPAACSPNSEWLRLYLGAPPNNPVYGMFSFFPAIAADGDAGFSRPAVSLDDEYFNSGNWQAPKGANRNSSDLSLDTLRNLWDSLVTQVRNAGLVLGTHAVMPDRRMG